MAIVIGVPHHNILGVVKSLGIAGERITLIMRHKNNDFVSKSKYVSACYYAESEDELYSLLQGKLRTTDAKEVILTCDDISTMQIDSKYEQLNQYYRTFNCGKQGGLTSLMNKSVQCEMARRVNLNVPEYISCLPLELLGRELPYPCIIRPLESINGGKNIVVCQRRDELDGAVEKFCPNTKVLVQRFLEKDSEIVVLGMSQGGEVILPGYVLKHREVKGGTTYSTVFAMDTIVELIDPTKNLIKSMRYEGLFGIEFLKSEGKYYFIEVNLRSDATTFALTAAGANLPEMYVNSQPVQNGIRETKAIVEFADFPLVLKRELSLCQWLRDIRNAGCRYYFDKDDMSPFFSGGIVLIRQLLKLVISKIK